LGGRREEKERGQALEVCYHPLQEILCAIVFRGVFTWVGCLGEWVRVNGYVVWVGWCVGGWV
jgi:hypothetical protein